MRILASYRAESLVTIALFVVTLVGLVMILGR